MGWPPHLLTENGVPSGGPRFARFCSENVRQTKGRWARRPLELERWERDFWDEALEIDPDSERRVYQEVGLGLPTKNGKSTQASAAGLYFLLADDEAEPEVIIAAAARPQARIVFGQSRTMAQASPHLMDYVRVLQHSIEAPRTGGIMRSVAADAPLQHGANPSACVIDEIHAHRNTDLYTALTKSGAAREQPFTLWITTAGGTGEGLLAELYGQMYTGEGELEERDGLRIYRDKKNGVLVWWYGAARDADIEDPATWALVNPASWLRDGLWLRQQYARLRARGALLEWRTWHLNQLVDWAERAVPLDKWRDCQGPDELRPDLPLGVGVYRTGDGVEAAIVLAQKQGEKVVVRAEHFHPQAVTGQASSIAIRARLLELRELYRRPMSLDPKEHNRPIPGPAVAFSSYNLEEIAGMLTLEGVNMVKFPLYAGTMGPASTLATELIVNGRLVHDGDPILQEHVLRTDAQLTDRGMIFAAGKAPAYNPSAIALASAVQMALQEPPANRRTSDLPNAVGF